MLRNRFPEQCALKGSNRLLSLHWTSLAEGNANFSIVIVFRYADDLMVALNTERYLPRAHGSLGEAGPGACWNHARNSSNAML